MPILPRVLLGQGRAVPIVKVGEDNVFKITQLYTSYQVILTWLVRQHVPLKTQKNSY